METYTDNYQYFIKILQPEPGLGWSASANQNPFFAWEVARGGDRGWLVGLHQPDCTGASVWLNPTLVITTHIYIYISIYMYYII